MASPFSLLVADLEGVKRLPPLPSARHDHEAAGELEDTLEIDLAPLLGLESGSSAPHRVLRLENLSAVGLFRLSESNEQLSRSKAIQGWPSMLCYDVSLFAAMHRAPSHEGSGKSLLDLYGLLADRPRLRPLYLYLLERVARAFPDLVRPELRLELYYNDMRFDAMMAGAEAPAPMEPAEVVALQEELGVLPSEERSPNDSAGS